MDGDYTQGRQPSRDQLRELLEQLAEQLREDPDDLHLRLKLAEVFRLLGRTNDAVKVYSGVAWAQAVAGNLVQAIMLCQVILEVAPDHMATQKMLAKLYASKEVRERKRSLPVVQRDGRWVVEGPKSEPTATPAPARAPAKSTAVDDLGPTPPPFDDGDEEGLEEVPGKNAVLSKAEGESGWHVSKEPSDAFAPGSVIVPDVPEEPPIEVAATEEPSIEVAATEEPPIEVAATEEPPICGPVDPEAECDRPSVASPVVDQPALRSRQTAPGYLTGEALRRPGGDSGEQDEAQLPRNTASYGDRHAPVEDYQGPPAEHGTDPAHKRMDTWTLTPVPGEQRTVRATKPMPDVALSTMLRKDAEEAFHDERRGPTAGHEAIRREVRRQGRQLEGLAPAVATQEQIDRDLRDTLKQIGPGEETGDEAGRGASLPVWPLFSALDPGAFISLINRLQRRTCEPGELVLEEGDPGDSLLLVSAGHLQVFKVDDDERPVELARLGPGSFFGEFALLSDQRRHASVRGLDDCELLELRREVLGELIREHPSVGSTLQVFYEQRVLEMVLATSPLFLAVSPDERMLVAERFARRRYGAGEQIVVEGRESSFNVILLGEVEVSCAGKGGRRVELAVLSEGDYFGEMSLLSGEPAEATIQATRPTETLTLHAQDFYELASLHPEIWAEVQRACRARQAHNRQVLSSAKAEALLL